MLVQIASSYTLSPLHLALIWSHLTSNDGQEGRLTFTIGTNQCNMLSLQQAEGGILKDGTAAKAM